MIQTKDSNLTFRPLTIDDAEQYNALLRYAFQVTEQELSESGWKDDEIKAVQIPGSRPCRCARLFLRGGSGITVRGLSAGHEYLRCPLSRRFCHQRLHLPGIHRPGHHEKD